MPQKNAMNLKVTYSFEIEYPETMTIDSKTLQGNIVEAVYEYDELGRLFNGQRDSNGGSAILATSIEVEKTARERSFLDILREQKEVETPPFWEACGAETDGFFAIDERSMCLWKTSGRSRRCCRMRTGRRGRPKMRSKSTPG